LLQGDDNLMVHSENVAFPWQVGMAGLGFDSEAIYRATWTTAEFCSNRLYELKDGYVFGPKPGKVLAKYGYIINPPVNVSRESMMRGVALGLQQLCNHIPPIKLVIDRTLELTKGHEAYFQRGFMDHQLKADGFIHETTPMIKSALYDQYYYTDDIHRSLTKTVKNLGFGDKWQNNHSFLLFDRDTSGPQLIFTS